MSTKIRCKILCPKRYFCIFFTYCLFLPCFYWFRAECKTMMCSTRGKHTKRTISPYPLLVHFPGKQKSNKVDGQKHCVKKKKLKKVANLEFPSSSIIEWQAFFPPQGLERCKCLIYAFVHLRK